jgi:uncharacterized membrane protein YkoI
MRYLLSAAMIALAGSALAQGVAQPGYIKGDIMAFRGNAQSLIDAIGKIEQSTGGRVVEIRFSDAGGIPGFYAAVVKGGHVDFMSLAAESGRLLPIEQHDMPVWMLTWRGQADVKFAEEAKTPLAQAIVTAERADDNMPAIAAGIARSASNPTSDVHAYNVLIDAGGNARRISIDSASGEIIADPQALAGWP